MRIALATAAQYPDLADDDRVLHQELKRRAIDTTPVIWDSEADWSAFDTVVVRSIWDYHLKYDKFGQWLNTLAALGTAVHNPLSVLRWNSDKRYLAELEQRGVRITPTRIIEQNSKAGLDSILAETGWTHYVVKPTVSSTGYQTWFAGTPVTDADRRQFAAQSASMDLLVQQFAEGVHRGERSFVFIAGAYTHCILKRAAANEFRVHIEHGGSVERTGATREEIGWAESVIAAWGESEWTYARVDAVADDSGLMLMELELLDPELFFSYDANAVERFIERIQR